MCVCVSTLLSSDLGSEQHSAGSETPDLLSVEDNVCEDDVRGV